MKLKLDANKKYAVALEGGGAKGAYQIGAWRALREAGIQFSAVAGTSVGALNGALMVMDDLPKAEKIWSEIRYSKVMDVDDETMKKLRSLDFKDFDWRGQLRFLKETLVNRGLDVTPLRQWMAELVDEDKIRNAAPELFIQTYSLTDRKELELRARDLKEPGEILDMLLASAYFPAFRNEMLGGKRYADGGLQDVIPLHVLVEHGYRNLIAIRLFGVGLERNFKIPCYVNVHTVLPSADLGGTLDFSAEQSKKNLQLGYFDTMRMLYGLAGQRYYIDSQWDETQCYQFLLQYLQRYLKDFDASRSLREIHEKTLPRLGRSLGCKGDYRMLLHSALEQAAEEAQLDPFKIRTEAELLQELKPKFGQTLPVYPKFVMRALSSRGSFIKSKRLWDRRKKEL